MNEIEKLRNDARAVIAGYKAGDDFDAVVNSLAASPIESPASMLFRTSSNVSVGGIFPTAHSSSGCTRLNQPRTVSFSPLPFFFFI